MMFRRFAVAAVLFCALSVASGAVVFYDDFNRADGDPGSPWTCPSVNGGNGNLDCLNITGGKLCAPQQRVTLLSNTIFPGGVLPSGPLRASFQLTASHTESREAYIALVTSYNGTNPKGCIVGTDGGSRGDNGVTIQAPLPSINCENGILDLGTFTGRGIRPYDVFNQDGTYRNYPGLPIVPGKPYTYTVEFNNNHQFKLYIQGPDGQFLGSNNDQDRRTAVEVYFPYPVLGVAVLVGRGAPDNSSSCIDNFMLETFADTNILKFYDDFQRPNGLLGSNWTEYHQLDYLSPGPAPIIREGQACGANISIAVTSNSVPIPATFPFGLYGVVRLPFGQNGPSQQAYQDNEVYLMMNVSNHLIIAGLQPTGSLVNGRGQYRGMFRGDPQNDQGQNGTDHGGPYTQNFWVDLRGPAAFGIFFEITQSTILISFQNLATGFQAGLNIAIPPMINPVVLYAGFVSGSKTFPACLDEFHFVQRVADAPLPIWFQDKFQTESDGDLAGQTPTGNTLAWLVPPEASQGGGAIPSVKVQGGRVCGNSAGVAAIQPNAKAPYTTNLPPSFAVSINFTADDITSFPIGIALLSPLGANGLVLAQIKRYHNITCFGQNCFDSAQVNNCNASLCQNAQNQSCGSCCSRGLYVLEVNDQGSGFKQSSQYFSLELKDNPFYELTVTFNGTVSIVAYITQRGVRDNQGPVTGLWTSPAPVGTQRFNRVGFFFATDEKNGPMCGNVCAQSITVYNTARNPLPPSVTVDSITHNQFSVHWSSAAGANRGMPFVSYDVTVWKLTSTSSQLVSTTTLAAFIAGNPTADFTIGQLQPQTDYVVTVSSRTVVGVSQPSNPVYVTTGVTPITIVSIVANGDSSSPAFSDGDTVTITFSGPTNQPPVGSKELVDLLFTGSSGASLGLNYQGNWASPSVLTISVINSTIEPFLAAPIVGSYQIDFSRQAALTASTQSSPFVLDYFAPPAGSLAARGWWLPSWAANFGVPIGTVNAAGQVCSADKSAGFRPESLQQTPAGIRASMDFVFSDTTNQEVYFVLLPTVYNVNGTDAVIVGLDGGGNTGPVARVSRIGNSDGSNQFPDVNTRYIGTGRLNTMTPGTTYKLIVEFNSHDLIRFNIRDNVGYLLDSWLEADAAVKFNSIGFAVGRNPAAVPSCIDNFSLAFIKQGLDAYGAVFRDSMKLGSWSGGNSAVSAAWYNPVAGQPDNDFAPYPNITAAGACATGQQFLLISQPANDGIPLRRGVYRGGFFFRMPQNPAAPFGAFMVLSAGSTPPVDQVFVCSFQSEYINQQQVALISISNPNDKGAQGPAAYTAIPISSLFLQPNEEFKIIVSWDSTVGTVSVRVRRVRLGQFIAPAVTAPLPFVPLYTGMAAGVNPNNNQGFKNATYCARDFLIEVGPYLTDSLARAIPLTSASPPASVSGVLTGTWGASAASWPATASVTASYTNATIFGSGTVTVPLLFSADAKTALSTCAVTALNGALTLGDVSAAVSLITITQAQVLGTGGAFNVKFVPRSDIAPPFPGAVVVTCNTATAPSAYIANFPIAVTPAAASSSRVSISAPASININQGSASFIGTGVSVFSTGNLVTSLLLSLQPLSAGNFTFSDLTVGSAVSCSPACGSNSSFFNITGKTADLNTILQTLKYYSAGNLLAAVSLVAAEQAPSTSTASAKIALLPVCSANTPAVNLQTADVKLIGAQIVVTFDSQIVVTATANAVFACSLVFTVNGGVGIDTLLGVGSFCVVGTNSITLVSGSGASITTSTTLVVKGGIKRCADGADASGSLPSIAGAVSPPQIFLSAPSSIGSCPGGSVKVLAFVTNLGGRPATNVVWTVGGNIVATDPNNPLSLEIPQANLPVGTTTISLSLSNFLGTPATPQSVAITKAALELPIAKIIGPLSAIQARDSLTLYVGAASCGQVNAVGLSYLWIPPPGISNVLTGLTGQFFRVGSSGLPAGTSTFRCNVTRAVDSVTVQASFDVVVNPSPLVAFIVNGLSTTASTVVDITLDGTKSRDPDTGTNAGLAYAWTCNNAITDQPCTNTNGAVLSLGTTGTITLPTTSMAVGPVSITLTVSKDSRTASFTQTIFIIAGNPPSAPILTFGSNILNPTQVLRLGVTPSGGLGPYTIQWSVASGNLDISAFNTTSRFLIVPGQGLFVAGSVYNFQVTVTDSLGQSATSVTAITINAAPSSGSITVSPLSGLAFNTTFTISAPNWVDANSPIYYDFFYVDPFLGVRIPLAIFPTTDNFISVSLPMGSPARGYNVTVGVRVIDSLGAVVTPLPTFSVHVAPPAAVDNSIATALTQLGTSTGDATAQISLVTNVLGTINTGIAGAVTAQDARRAVLNVITSIVSTLSADVIANNLPAIVANPTQVDLNMVQQVGNLVGPIWNSTQISGATAEELLSRAQACGIALARALNAVNYLLFGTVRAVSLPHLRSAVAAPHGSAGFTVQAVTNIDVYVNVWNQMYYTMSQYAANTQSVPGDTHTFSNDNSMVAILTRHSIGSIQNYAGNCSVVWSNPDVSLTGFSNSNVDTRFIYSATNPFTVGQPSIAYSGVATVHVSKDDGTAYTGDLTSNLASSPPLRITLTTSCTGACSPACYRLDETSKAWVKDSKITTSAASGNQVTCNAYKGGIYAVFASSSSSSDSSDTTKTIIIAACAGGGGLILVGLIILLIVKCRRAKGTATEGVGMGETTSTGQRHIAL